MPDVYYFVRYSCLVMAMFAAMFTVVSCSSSQLAYYSLPQTLADKQVASATPDQNALRFQKKSLALVATHDDLPFLSKKQVSTWWLTVVQQAFQDKTNYRVEYVGNNFSSANNFSAAEAGTQSTNVFTQIGKAGYVGLLHIKKPDNLFNAEQAATGSVPVTMEYYNTAGTLVAEENLFLNEQASVKQNIEQIVPFIWQHFPLQGFVIELRANREYGKISIGRSSGVLLGMVFEVQNTKNDKVTENNPSTQCEIVAVFEDYSIFKWVKGNQDLLVSGAQAWHRFP